jgi:DNA-binding response OmpR family regulator
MFKEGGVALWLETELQGIGADDYIIKPFDPAHIVAHCRMLLSDGLAAARMVGELGSQ